MESLATVVAWACVVAFIGGFVISIKKRGSTGGVTFGALYVAILLVGMVLYAFLNETASQRFAFYSIFFLATIAYPITTFMPNKKHATKG